MDPKSKRRLARQHIPGDTIVITQVVGVVSPDGEPIVIMHPIEAAMVLIARQDTDHGTFEFSTPHTKYEVTISANSLPPTVAT